MFFVFDGIDGAGKSTQLELFVAWLKQKGLSVITCKDPGSTKLGERLRELLLGRHEIPIAVRTEMMMFTSARTQLVQEIIKPALAKNQVVVLDRYILSTIVYQGHAGDLPPDEIRSINRMATEGITPDRTFVLDIDVDAAMKRIGQSRDRMESRGDDYFRKVRDGFLVEASLDPQAISVVDASRTSDEIHQEICDLAIADLES